MSQGRYQRLTVLLPEGRMFELYRTGLFVITKRTGESYENDFGSRVRPQDVLARGRMRDANTLRVTRGPLSVNKVRDLLRGAKYNVTVISGRTR